MIERKLEISYSLEPRDVNNIIVAALEGGINYWCNKATTERIPKQAEDKIEFTSDVVGYGGIIKLYEDEGGSHLLTLDKFLTLGSSLLAPLFAGGLVVAVVVSVPTYLVARRLVERARQRRSRRRARAELGS